jgi:hypothetical protein
LAEAVEIAAAPRSAATAVTVEILELVFMRLPCI